MGCATRECSGNRLQHHGLLLIAEALSMTIGARREQLRNRSSPSSLMRCAAAAAGVAIEVLVEIDELAEGWIRRVLRMHCQ